MFMLLPMGFCNAELRAHVAKLLGYEPQEYPVGRMTYDLRRLRLHGIIVREVGSNRYHVTDTGMRICLLDLGAYSCHPARLLTAHGRMPKCSKQTGCNGHEAT